MDANARREAIYQTIAKSDQPIKGGELARRFAVSRQVIVQDVALLRLLLAILQSWKYLKMPKWLAAMESFTMMLHTCLPRR